jgi:tyrosine-protein kinase Etk/Wzc
MTPLDTGLQQSPAGLSRPSLEPSRAELDRDDEIDLGALLATLWGARWILAAFASVGVLAGMFMHASTAPEFTAAGLIQLENRSARLALPLALQEVVDSSPAILTETEILRSRNVLARAAANSRADIRADPVLAPFIGQALAGYDLRIPEIDWLVRFARKGTRIDVDHLQVPPEWLGTFLVVEITGHDTYDVLLPDGRSLTGSVGETVTQPVPEFALRVAALSGPVGREFRIRQLTEQAAVRAIRDSLRVSERSKGSSVLEIRYSGPDARLAVKLVDAIIAAYIGQNIDRSAADIQAGIAFIEDQLVASQGQIEDAAARLDARAATNLNLSVESLALIEQLNAIDRELRGLGYREESIAERYTENHPVYREIQRERERLEIRRSELQDTASVLPEAEREVLSLRRELALAEATYGDFRKRLQELMVLRASTVGNVRVLETAELFPGTGRAPPLRTVALFGLIGLVIGAAFVFVRERLRTSVQGPEEIEQQGIPVFATINHTKLADEKDRKRPLAALVAATSPDDVAVEGLRSLRTSLHFGLLDSPTRSITITSAAPDAGKSFTAANLGVVSANAGQRVCVVDADLRRGRLRRYFDVRRDRAGLTEFLSGDATLDEVLIETSIPGLAFIHSGRLPPNPSELLMRPTLRSLVGELDRRFEMSLFDCPPVLAVTDPIIVGRATGATMIIVRHRETQVQEIAAMKKAFSSAGVPLSGAVLNGYDPRRTAYGYAYRYRYNYTYRYRYASADKDK